MKCLYPIAEKDLYVFTLEPIDSKMYCMLHNNRALIIDPCISVLAKQFLLKHNVKDITVILTHEHIDHISGVNMLRQIAKCKVICSEKCAERIVDSRKNAAAYFEGMYSMRTVNELEQIKALKLSNYTCCADKTFKEKIEFDWYGLNFKCIEMPGHSPGGIVIIVNNKYIFSGDNYIPGEKVITRLPGGSKKDYEKYIKPFFKNISSGCVIYPGHGSCVKIG